MRRKKTVAFILLTVIVLAILFVGLRLVFWEEGILISVRNDGSATITEVTIDMGGEKYIIPTLLPKTSSVFRYYPGGEGNIILSYTRNGRPYSLGVDTSYHNKGDSGRVLVSFRDETVHTKALIESSRFEFIVRPVLHFLSPFFYLINAH